MGDRRHNTALFDQFARVGQALASGKRLELLDLLAQGERDVADLFARLREVAQSHLPDVEAARAAYLGADGGRPVTRDELHRLATTSPVTVLHAHGRDATRLADGTLEWRLADLPVAA